MFDCPEHSQTSPTRTSFKVTVCGPEKISSYGPPAAGTSLSICHFPSVPATAEEEKAPIAIETFFPGSVQPQKRLALSRCRTICSAKIGLKKGRLPTV